MIGLVMAGGKGTRMDAKEEKLLLQYKKPVVIHVIDALKSSNCFSKIMAATSDNSPNTQSLLQNNGIETIKTKGDGYVSDLNAALSYLHELTLVVSGDLPLLDGGIIKDLVASYDGGAWQSFLVTKKFLDDMNMMLEFSVNHDNKECYYTGISIVDPKKISSTNTIKETYRIIDDKRLALNLNTKRDYDLLKGA
ncbi:NTP transferase domain-containing protein [Candidatus Nitrosotenuis sp. DW1]|uniref:NTP transferase domain-containing protein n=1 Tax=Candidatus Nitrosotenuis sp. DW1 TaxID=2259672 RepID=UPI0015CE586D|nr:NTP transferase domain-containing protein [Candidatus Nitrosotenuis sp. DW1]QLH08296.1 5-deoxyadenosylcobinamide phosphate nucleotidyltransferase [Candidatus Nitrosotenuis sp. DW1]